ncbi:MAG: hypothetical protein RI935_226 [Candidatus Parcubacteria bacterium]|jgi:hypothetical protein
MLPEITITKDAITVVEEGGLFVMKWIEQGTMLVTGPDTCYFLVESALGLSKIMCEGGSNILILPNL